MKKSEPLNPGENNLYRNADKDHDIKGSIPKSDFFNGVEEEILNAITAGGIVPNEDNTQLAAAILKIAQNGLFSSVDDTLKIVNGILSAAAWIGTVKSKILTGTVIQPEVNPNVIYKDLSEATTFTFDNSKLANLPDGAQFRFELQLNIPTVVGFSFDPIPQFDLDNEPDFSEPGLYFINFHTFDKGATWYLEVVNRFAARPLGGS